MTPLKGRCIKGWWHVRDIRSPSRLPHFFIFEPSRQCNGRERDLKCEGNVRDIADPSRPSNALHIRAWGLSCEYVRVKLNGAPHIFLKSPVTLKKRLRFGILRFLLYLCTRIANQWTEKKHYVLHRHHHCYYDLSHDRRMASYRHQDGILLGHTTLGSLSRSRTLLLHSGSLRREHLSIIVLGCVRSLIALGHWRTFCTKEESRKGLVSHESETEERILNKKNPNIFWNLLA